MTFIGDIKNVSNNYLKISCFLGHRYPTSKYDVSSGSTFNRSPWIKSEKNKLVSSLNVILMCKKNVSSHPILYIWTWGGGGNYKNNSLLYSSRYHVTEVFNIQYSIDLYSQQLSLFLESECMGIFTDGTMCIFTILLFFTRKVTAKLLFHQSRYHCKKLALRICTLWNLSWRQFENNCPDGDMKIVLTAIWKLSWPQCRSFSDGSMYCTVYKIKNNLWSLLAVLTLDDFPVWIVF